MSSLIKKFNNLIKPNIFYIYFLKNIPMFWYNNFWVSFYERVCVCVGEYNSSLIFLIL